MAKDTILVLGALGQIGTELTASLREIYGENQVIASDIADERKLIETPGLYEHINVLDKEKLAYVIDKYKVTHLYLLAAILSAVGETNPKFAWNLNMESLFNVLEIAAEKGIKKIFWPSSIAIFGSDTPKINTPQNTTLNPTTAYGISKLAGEMWVNYFFLKKGLDIRSVRYPGLISYKTLPGGGTTDYAVEIFYAAKRENKYQCFLRSDTILPMMYMPDALRACIELMEAPAADIRVRSSYNIAGMSFSPADLAAAIQQYLPDFSITYKPDFRQEIADSWTQSIDDSQARNDWHWQPKFTLSSMVNDMLENVKI
ncbi:MAG: NAD-dependent epimerase/dehydratase family protein [Chitinophagales bacterium]|nr:NAD-dependent epimerase/dehydratase family protein [Bacteroidota bacterium]MCB9044298.1 NAD-dependent epimerase/dehydratase family protein [Chitinophagales bacterium]